MERNQSRKLANYIIEITKEPCHQISSMFDASERFVFFVYKDKRLTFQGKSADTYFEGLDIVLDEKKLSARYSVKTLTDQYQQLIGQILEKRDCIKRKVVTEAVCKWYISLLERPNQTFKNSTVVEGLRIFEEFEVGLCCLESLTQIKYEEIYKQFIGSKGIDDDSIQEYYSKLLSPFNPDNDTQLAFMSTSCLVRDIDYSRELALSRFQEALHLLRFMGIGVEGFNHRWSVNLRDSFSDGSMSLLTLIENERWRIKHTVGAYQIDVAKFDYKLLELLNKIVGKEEGKRNQIDKYIIRSINWIGKAAQERAETSQFLNLVIALESLLCPDRSNLIRKKMSNRVAYLLDSEPENQKTICSSVKKIYDIRSKIVHSGAQELDRKDRLLLPKLVNYTCLSVISVAELSVENSWTEFSELKKYLENFMSKQFNAKTYDIAMSDWPGELDFYQSIAEGYISG